MFLNVLLNEHNINLKFNSHQIDILVMPKNKLCYSLKMYLWQNKIPGLIDKKTLISFPASL